MCLLLRLWWGLNRAEAARQKGGHPALGLQAWHRHGDDVASKIRDLDGTKTILISAYELERERVNELNACHCIVDLVHKPVSIKILMERVQQALT